MNSDPARIHELDEEFESKEINLLEYGMKFWKRRWLITAVTIGVFLPLSVITFRRTPVYTATSTIIIEQEPNILSFEQLFQIEPYWDDTFYQTQYALLQGKTVGEEAGKILKAAGKRTKPAAVPAFASDQTPEADFADLDAGASIGPIKVRPVKGTRLAEVSLTSRDPQFAADSVNAVCEAFIKVTIATKYKALGQGTAFLRSQISSLRTEIEQKEKELQAFGAKQDVIPLNDKGTAGSDALGNLNKALTDATIDRLAKEALYNEIRTASPDNLPAAMTNLNPLIQKMREDYSRLSRDYAKKLETYKPDYPEMLRLNAEVDAAKSALTAETQNLINTAGSDYQTALNKERSLQTGFNKQKQEATAVHMSTIAYGSLKSEIDNKRSVLENLLRRESETGLSAQLSNIGTSNIKIVEAAEVPSSPSSPGIKQGLLKNVFLGLIAALGLAFFLDYLDNSVKNSEDVKKYLKLPTWGGVPAFTKAGDKRKFGPPPGSAKGDAASRKPKDEAAVSQPPREESPHPKSIELITSLSPKSLYSESYRGIQTALLLSSSAHKARCLVVSSALPGEGKTATICNLAVSLAQTRKRVLIIDGDLWKPRQHSIFKLRNLNGLTNYLTSDVKLKSLIKSTFVPNLYLINAGPVPPNPAVLLSSEKMAAFLEDLRKIFDYILIDSPPVLAATGAMILSSKTEGVILVVWSGKTPRAALKRAKEKLDLLNINVLGVVLNRVDISRHNYNNEYLNYYYYDKNYGEHEDSAPRRIFDRPHDPPAPASSSGLGQRGQEPGGDGGDGGDDRAGPAGRDPENTPDAPPLQAE